jgi:hypothetical protein
MNVAPTCGTCLEFQNSLVSCNAWVQLDLIICAALVPSFITSLILTGLNVRILSPFNLVYLYIFYYYAVSRKVAGSIPDEVNTIFNWPNPFSRTMTLGSIQPLTEMSTRNLPGGEGRPVRKADNLTAICEPTV